MTLYLKYRPQKIADLDIVSVRETLTSIIESQSLPHAFLFSGPRGTGKTSAARILAKAINCEKNENHPGEPCNECETCRAITACTHIDVIEMDAASNRGIDDVRSLKQELMLAPHTARRKIYIIDEAHMLTTEAANALLKTLEEPPAHVLFILATTDAHKLPQTILSRLSSVQFRRATREEVSQKLVHIAASEKLTVDPGVFEFIASASDGAFRDAVKLLEELSLKQKNITTQAAQKYLFGTRATSPELLLTLLSQKNTQEALSALEELSSQGAFLKPYLAELVALLHKALLASFKIGSAETYGFTKDEIVTLLELFIEASRKLTHTSDQVVPLLVAVVSFCSPREKEKPKLPETKEDSEKKVHSLPTEPKRVISATAAEPSAVELSTDLWTRLLTEVRTKNASVEALLRAAHPTRFDGKTLEIGVYYQFHKERLEVNLHRDAFEEAAHAVFGAPVKVSYELTDRPATMPTQPSDPNLTMPKAPDIIEAAKEIFGN